MTRGFLVRGTVSVIAAAMVSSTAVRLAAQGPPPPPKAAPPPGWIDPRNPPKEDPNWQPPRTADGQPNIEGQWGQASDIITYSIEDPEAERAGHTAISGQRPMVGRPIIDPIDGTRQFTRSRSTYFGCVLALAYKGEVVAAFFAG